MCKVITLAGELTARRLALAILLAQRLEAERLISTRCLQVLRLIAGIFNGYQIEMGQDALRLLAVIEKLLVKAAMTKVHDVK